MIRRLSDQERSLWLRVARTVRLSPGRSLPETPAIITDQPAGKPASAAKRTGETFGATTRDPEPARTAPAADLSGQRKIRRGQTPVDARIDLHGHTQDSAQRELIAFVHREQARGSNCLLVITGKGRAGGGVLRKRFVEWLEGPEIRPLISGYASSHPRHGGDGAFYLMLKRKAPAR